MWINVDDVKQFTGVKPQHLKLANDDINSSVCKGLNLSLSILCLLRVYSVQLIIDS